METLTTATPTTEDSSNLKNSEIHQSLHAAAAEGSIHAVQSLVAQGADINSIDERGNTALHCAVEAEHLIVTEFLINNRADLKIKNLNGETALHVAGKHDDHQVVELLIAAGTDINAQDSSGCTALHVACQKHSVNAALSLLHSQISVDIVDNTGETALHKSCRENLLPVVQAMCAVGSRRECPVNVFNKAGQAALHLASRVGNAELVRCLLLSGADIDLVNKDGVRAEDIALGQGHTELADFLSKLSASMSLSKHDPYLSQLLPSDHAIWRIKVKLFGNCYVGKSTLVGSLKCGYIRGLFRHLTGSASSGAVNSQPTGSHSSSSMADDADAEAGNGKSPIIHENCTRCVEVTNVNVSGAGDLSVWEFSGYEPYYAVYDHFVGDPNCIHIVVFRASDPIQTQLEQLHFWLDFIRARIAPAEPIGFAGTQLWAPRVLLVATHADRASSSRRNLRGETEFPGESSLVTSLQKEFGAELLIAPRICTLDARQAASADMKAFKAVLGEMKQFLCQYLPPSLGFLESTVTALPSWTRLLGGYPVVRWQTFVEYIRSRVHILATESHLQELICQLQLMGEVVYIESDTQDLIVLDPGWLFRDVIGRLLSPVMGIGLQAVRRDGIITAENISTSFPGLDTNDLTSLLIALELCSPAIADGSGYHVACLNQLPASANDENDWTSKSGVRYGGTQLRAANCTTIQLRHLFRRIQQALWNQHYQHGDNTSAARLTEWSSGTSIYLPGVDESDVSVAVDRERSLNSSDQQIIVVVTDNGRTLTVACIGHDPEQLYRLQNDVLSVILKVIEACCPGLFVERAPISPQDVKLWLRNRQSLRAYQPRDVIRAMLNEDVEVRSDVIEGGGSDTLVDLVAFGSAELYSTLRPVGPDLHVSHMPIYSRCRLASMLDPVHPLGHDWCLLAVALGLSDAVPQVDSSQTVTLSRTDAVLAVWSHDAGATVRRLYDCLCSMLQRPDVAEQLLALTPIVGPDSSLRQPSSSNNKTDVSIELNAPIIDDQTKE